MTKSKTKQGMPEICFNCKFAEQAGYFPIIKIICTKTYKKYNWNYSCKKWREME